MKKGNRSSLKKTRSWRVRGKSVRTVIHVRYFPDLPGGEIAIEGTSFGKHCTTQHNKEKSKDKNGWGKKKRREHCSKIELVLLPKEEGEIEAALKMTRSWRGGGKSKRTLIHGRHFPDLPGGEITIEGNSTVKHCTTATKQRKVQG